jgi:predicted nucleic acid-binding protein
MSARVFLDTNIFVYAVDAQSATPVSGAKAAIADDLIRGALESQNAWISYQVIQEFFNVALRKFTVPMPVEYARRYLSTVFRSFGVVHSSFGLFSEATEICSRYRLSWYDSIILAAAAEAGCEVIYTEDLQHGSKVNGVLVENPFRGAT